MRPFFMSFSSKYDWYYLGTPEDGLALAKETIHQAVQCVSAVGRTFSTADETEEDQNAKLTWVPGLWRMAGVWVDGAQTFRSSLSLKEQKLYLVDPRLNVLGEFPLEGHNYKDLLLWLEQEIISQGLSASNISTDLPYQLPDYALDFSTPYTFASLKQCELLGGYYHNAFILFQSIAETSEHNTGVSIYPHHFDLEIKVILKNTGELATDTFVRLGFSPGDAEISEPYYYLNGWPQVTGDQLPSAPMDSHWVDDEWSGLVLECSHVYDRPDQASYLHQFLTEGLQLFKNLLLD